MCFGIIIMFVVGSFGVLLLFGVLVLVVCLLWVYV